ncbi:MAG: hypothetical protein ACR2O1_00045 [Boseongicola sp.]
MKPIALGAARDLRVFAISDRLGQVVARVLRGIRRQPAPEAWREHDPRKAETSRLDPATPAHLLGAGARAEFFRLPRL